MEKTNITHDPERYENIFNMYSFENDNKNKYVFYNITSKVVIPNDLDESVFLYYTIPAKMPWTTISHKIYNTQHLWWLIATINNIRNPVKLLQEGTIIKVIDPKYIDGIFDSIKQKI